MGQSERILGAQLESDNRWWPLDFGLRHAMLNRLKLTKESRLQIVRSNTVEPHEATKQPFVIHADMREQRSGVTRLLQQQHKIDVQFSALPIGDFVLSEDVVVERKAAVDFVTSIMDRRLFGQVEQMCATYPRSIIMIEGDVFGTRSAISRESLEGALSWLSVIKGVAVHTVSSTSASASMLATMVRHAQVGLGYEVPLRAGRPKDLHLLSQFCTEGLPGCGPTTAKLLLAHFGTVGAVFAASVEDLCNVKGVGKKTAVAIRELIDHRVSC